VLFVDDNNAFLEAITELYTILGDQTWEIHRASTADQALAALKQNAIDLVVLDIGMPVLDGVQLLGLIHRRYPDVKKAILTASASAGDRAGLSGQRGELFIQKPLSDDGMKAVFTTLNELITWAQRKGFSGMLRQVDCRMSSRLNVGGAIPRFLKSGTRACRVRFILRPARLFTLPWNVGG